MIRLFLVSILSAIILFSCKKKDNMVVENDHILLFSQSADLLKEFTTGISTASDSLTVDSLMLELDHRLANINFSFPALTDLKLTEQENDSLIKLMSVLKQAEVNKLKELETLYHNRSDSKDSKK